MVALKDYKSVVVKFNLGVKLDNFISSSNNKTFTKKILISFIKDNIHHSEHFSHRHLCLILNYAIKNTNYFYDVTNNVVYTFIKAESNIDKNIKEVSRLIDDSDDLVDIFKKCYKSDIHDMVELWNNHIKPHPMVKSKFSKMFDFIFRYEQYKKDKKTEKENNIM